ncbi:1,4-dihydroxy-2-naphthoate octaprenyltransferase [Mangrovimonas cancribranchiae]|uniref:1,4-dihydroxy-2-naphthoate octaprenyltransferase n=1 Tax=Mangrovimonas cancribranchiae TaxID=3080055 RepID=A0AAU6NZT5_9FLAO
MNNFKKWLSAFRLRTLPLSVSGIIIAGSLAGYNGLFKLSTFVLALLTTISLQILSNIANDYGDGTKGTDNDDRIGPKRAIQSGDISPSQMFSAIKINILITILLAFLLVFTSFGSKNVLLAFIFIGLGVLSIYAALKYTVGNNPYGYKGLGDIFVFIFFGLVSVIGCYILFAKKIDHITILPACTIGLLSVGVLNLNNLRDIESDKKANKNTIAVKLGFINAKRYHYTLIGLAILLSFMYGVLYYVSIWNIMFFITYIPLIAHMLRVKRTTNPVNLDPELKKLALTTFLLSTLLAIGHLL